MQISVKSDLKRAQKQIEAIHRRHIPYATRVALNDTGFKAKEGLDKSTKSYLKNPTPFTQKATAVTKATKSRLFVIVYIKADRWDYLQFMVDGGVEHPKGRAIMVPVVRRNKYGNVPNKAVRRMLTDRKKYFSGKPKGGNRPAGVWRRQNGNRRIRLMVAYADSVAHLPRWPFHEIGNRIAMRWFPRNFDKAMKRAISTAK